MRSSALPVLEADALGKSFGRKEVLKSASFHAWPGRITTLMGRNGSGKSTMLRIAAGRLATDYGGVRYKGVLRGRSLATRARDGLMYSPQGSILVPRFTVREHLDMFTRIYGDPAILRDSIARLRLREVLDRRPAGLSGGERQRASLALAMIRSPECLLMDEPFAGLAPLDRPSIAGGLRLLRARGTAIVITGHDVEELFAVSDEIIWVTAGTTHWLGSPDEAGNHDQFGREYLGPRRSS